MRVHGPYPLRLEGDRLGELLLALYVALLPWEITRLFIPVLRTRYLDTSLSLIDGSRLWTLLPLVLVLPPVVARLAKEPSVPGLPVLAYGTFALGVGLLNSPDRMTAAAEVIRLLFNFLAVIMLAVHLRDGAAVRRVLRWFCLSVDAAALVVYAEFALHRYLWVSELAPSGRYNGPFVDPNTSARYFLVAAIVSVFCSPRRGLLARLGAPLEPLLLLGAMFLTGSRSSLLVAAIVLLAMAFLGDGFRRLVPLLALPAMVVLALLMVAVMPTFAGRLGTFTNPAALLGARTALVNAGFHMFLDHPLIGVGLSGFPVNLLGPYARYQSYYGPELTLSHTSLVTTAAELGAVGLLWFVVLGRHVVRAARRARRHRVSRTLASGAVLGILAIFLQSQSEGRFWEEPLLWALFGLLLALARNSTGATVERAAQGRVILSRPSSAPDVSESVMVR